MANQKLLTFVKEELARGVSQSDLKASLNTAGWPEADISEAFALAGGSSMPQPDQPTVVLQGTSTSTLLGAPALLSKAWAVYKERWVTFLAIMVAPALLSILISMGDKSINNIGTLPNPFIFFGGIVVAVLFMITINVWSNVALLHAIKGGPEQLGFFASYGRGARHIFSFLWVSILTTLVVMGGFIFLIVPGIIFSVWFMFGAMVVVDDNTRGMNALLKSREYVRGRWWGTVWRMFFMMLISILILIALVLFSFLLIFFGVSGGEYIISALWMPFGFPLMMTYLFMLYENLKVTRGSFVFAPTGKKKAPFVILATLAPVLIIVAIAVVVIFPLVSLNNARNLAGEDYIKTNLSVTRVSAEVYFSRQNSYEGVCESTEIKQAIDGITEKGAKEITCNTSITQYAISAALPSKGYFCVDNSENPAILTSSRGLASTETRCPTQ